jgi:uncharacterized protein
LNERPDPGTDGPPEASQVSSPHASRADRRPRTTDTVLTIDPSLAVAGLAIGIIVGLTGMGGGALMTPVLVFFFKIDPLTAISSDIVASLFMKPAAAVVHLRRGTVNLELVGWLCLGSVPAAFIGAFIVSALAIDDAANQLIKQVLGVALLVATGGLIVRSLLQMWRKRLPLGEGPAIVRGPPIVKVRRIPTVLLGAVAGFMVGVTSVGAGSIIIVILLLIYPSLKASALVGTDLTQAIPLVAAAAAGHLLFGDFSPVIAGSLLIGAIPGAWFGAHLGSRAPGGIIRRILAIFLLASGLKLIGVSTEWMLAAVAAAILGGSLAWSFIRSRVAGTTSTARTGDVPLTGTDANSR